MPTLAVDAVDLAAEKLIGRTDPETVRLNGGQPPSRQTWWSWLTAGRAGVVLPSVVVGGRRLTSPRALRDWIHAVTAAAGSGR